MNPYHTAFATECFIVITFFGDGIFCITIAVMLFFLNRRYLSLLVLSSFLLSGAIAQLLKYIIVEARPAVYLKDTTYNYFIDSITLHNYHGFPSGHTASAFALSTVIVLTGKMKANGLWLLLPAVMVGYSRISH